MTAKENFDARHQTATLKLHKIAVIKYKRYGIMVCCGVLSGILKISKNTVMNYVDGWASDGFLTEAMIIQFRKLNKTVCNSYIQQQILERNNKTRAGRR